MIKVSPEKYIEILQLDPDINMVLSGWEWERRTFLFIPYILYTKNLYNGR